MLLRALPYDSTLFGELREEQEKAQKAQPDLIRDRQAEFERRNAAQRAKEAG